MVGVYVRVSSESQNVESQLFPLRDYCKRMGLASVEEYVDNGFSGKDDKRPAFERLMVDIRAGKLDGVLVFKLDRIGRSLRHLLGLFEEFKNSGVEFISLTQNINSDTPEGKMFWQMLGVFAEYEREIIVSRTLSGIAKARRQGKTLGRPTGRKDSKPRRKSGYINRWANGGK